MRRDPPNKIDGTGETEFGNLAFQRGPFRAVAGNDARLRDWAQIGRYREANRAVTSADVVFMGDSITDNWPQPRFGAWFTARPQPMPMATSISPSASSTPRLSDAGGRIQVRRLACSWKSA